MYQFLNYDEEPKPALDFSELIQKPKPAEKKEPSILETLLAEIKPKPVEQTKPYSIPNLLDDIGKGWGGKTGKDNDILGALMGGLSGAGKYLGTTEGQKMAGMFIQDPYQKVAYNKLIKEQEIEDQRKKERAENIYNQQRSDYENMLKQLFLQKAGQDYSSAEAQKGREFEKELIQEKQEFESGEKEKDRINKLLIENYKSIQDSNLSKEIKTTALKKTADGWSYLSHFSPEMQNRIPTQAIKNIGTETDFIQMVKPAEKLASESAAKFSVASKAAQGALDILNGLNEKKYNWMEIQAATGGVTKKSTEKVQLLASRMDLITEGLGRALSGANVPESEIKNFINLFSIKTFDKEATIKYKLNRTIEIVNDMRILASYGLNADEIMLESTKRIQDETKLLNQSIGTGTKTPGITNPAAGYMRRGYK